MGTSVARGVFVFTSNVDGAFQKAGFSEERIVECHGSIHHLQCTSNCTDTLWQATSFFPEVDFESCRLTSVLPVCAQCGEVARPNVLMFCDGDWIAHRAELQMARLTKWLLHVERLAVIEIGAGIQIPTVRHFAESLGATVIRINPLPDCDADSNAIVIETTALNGIDRIFRALA